MTQLNPPFVIPGYRIMRRIGLGGMATVYLAVQQSLSRPVAIKVLASERMPSDDVVRRFEHEARTIARLDHPHIVSIYDVGRTSDGQIYYTMPYLPNGDLSTRNLQSDPQRVLAVMQALADALGYAHDHGIVHRDVKPENVLFDKLDRPLLADFGIALSASHQPRVTREGATLGSSGYMSPEQARGQPLDGRSDFYSLGVVCYELLTGEMPFQGADSLAIALAHIEKPVPRLPLTRRTWQPLIDKALAKQPEARFQSAEELLAAIAVIGKRLQAPPRIGFSKWWLPLVERFIAIPRRTRALVLLLLILLVFSGLLALLPQVPQRAAMPPVPSTDTPSGPELATAPAAPAASAAPGTPDATGPHDDSAAIGDATAAAPSGSDDTETRRLAREQWLKQAAELTSRGHLVAPDGDNAAERYLAVLQAEPRQRDAVRGVERLLGLLAKRAAAAIASGSVNAAGDPISQGIALAERANLAPGPAYDAFKAPIAHALEQRRARRHDPFDVSGLQPLAALLPTLARLDPEQARALQADLDRPATLLAAGGGFRDAEGPNMVVVPTVLAASARIEHAFAISTSDITRGAYERFVEATGRAAAPCRDAPRLFARSEGLNWRAPGFAQADDHPVVCVSWNDAEAYAKWLSQRTGARYRLPQAREWQLLAQSAGSGSACGAANIGHRSGKASTCDDGYAQTAPVGRFEASAPGLYDIAGNVSQWLGGCAKGDAQGCEHVFRGSSWRDDDSESNLERSGSSSGDTGYATVGFRLVRELPAPADAH
ncbi:MAG TPA: bifunctional serine/threonine-protein kinase/formylglycine-generating enzyme family protein [Dokdonella sp.]